ncbi:MAG: hypothetical protein J7M21_03285, partial [Planctomycetes bacterium]|nr:hypothetical protein [Planctomycetota bacterium]
IDSPARRDVAKKIIDGATAVWLLLESGDKARDDAAAKLLAAELKRVEAEIQVPDLSDAAWNDGAADKPPMLMISFPLIRLARSAEGEGLFVHMLMHTEPDLVKKYNDQPMVFAIFGQGRALWALVGEGINKENIDDVCAFLTGQCSCQIKDMNPGVDLLMAANWYAAFEDAPVTPQLPDLIGPAEVVTASVAEPNAGGAATASTRPAADIAGLQADAGSPFFRNLLIALGFMAAAAVALVIWVSRRSARN